MNKNQQLIASIQQNIQTNNTESLVENTAKLIDSFQRALKRTDKILSQSDMQQMQVLKLKEQLELTNDKVKLLLNNANQGFLLFDKEMIIANEYSKEQVEFLIKILLEKILLLYYIQPIRKKQIS